MTYWMNEFMMEVGNAQMQHQRPMHWFATAVSSKHDIQTIMASPEIIYTIYQVEL